MHQASWKASPTRFGEKRIDQGQSTTGLRNVFDFLQPVGQLVLGILQDSQNALVVEYALRDEGRPMGVAEYQLVEALPKDLESSLPSVERIPEVTVACERELRGMEEMGALTELLEGVNLDGPR